MATLKQVLDELRRKAKSARPEYIEGMAGFGIKADAALGIQLPQIRDLARYIGVDHELALRLWQQNIHEAKLLATMIDDPRLVTEDQMNQWAHEFYSWDVCDQCCSNLFDQTKYCDKKIFEWVKSDEEFVRRAGFVLMATSAVHHKKDSDEKFLKYLPVIEQYSTDERNFVKKAANWALRQIGKRSAKLFDRSLTLANKLAGSENPTARWIGMDARRELVSKRESIMKKG